MIDMQVSWVRKRLQLGYEEDIEACLENYMDALRLLANSPDGPRSTIDLHKICLADALLRSLEFPTDPSFDIPKRFDTPRPKDQKIQRLGSVYLMRNKRNNYTKIGFSKNPKYRESCLQSEEPEIELLASFKASMEIEGRLHEQYAEFRIRGEWFELSDKHISEIKRYFER